MGIGGLYIAEHARTNVSGGNRDQWRPGYCDVGSVDQVALAGLHAAVNWLENMERSQQLGSARQQIAHIETALREMGARCFAISAPQQRMPSAAFSLNGRPSSELAATLKARGILVGSGLQCAPLAHQTLGTDAAGLIRISVGMRQSLDDIEAAIEIIRELAAA